jgi:D-3-phosphoglycerate dehydrogenase
MTSRTRVACLDTWAPGVREIVARVAPDELALEFASSYDDAHQMGLARDAEVLFAGWAAVPKPMIEHARKLKFIQKFGIGYDRIDIEAARERGIGVAITAGSNAAPVSELTIGLMLAVYRRIAHVDRALREGRWLKSEMREVCFQLAGKTVGIFGFGNIGRKVAQRLLGFECKVIYFDAQRGDAATEARLQATYVSRDELFSQSDVLSLHAPLLAETANAVNAATIATMKDGAILINTARGELVDEAALMAALASGKLRGAGLDAFATEPLPAGHPLLTLDQVVVTPHIGGAVIDNVENVARHALGNIMCVLRGEPLRSQDVVVPMRP